MKNYFFSGRMFVAIILMLSLGCSGSESGSIDSGLSSETLENVARVLWMPEYNPSEVPENIYQRLNAFENSPGAFGERMSLRLEELIANPDSCSPDFADRYSAFLEYTSSMSAHEAYATTTLLGLDSSRGYKEVPPEIKFSFPRDDSPDNKYQVGWHFFVGSAFTESGEEFGIQLMFWHYAILPPSMAKLTGLSDLDNQVLEMHFAISKAGDRHYRTKPYIVAGTTGLISFSESPFNYEQGKNFIRSKNSESLFPLQLRAWGLDESKPEPVEMEINLILNQTPEASTSPHKGYVLNGDGGLSPSCGGVGTLYYSVPNLQLDSENSSVSLDGSKVSLSTGKFWYDHQYGTGFMPSGNPRSDVVRAFSNLEALVIPPDPGGWDWMMIQFDDDTEIGLSALHTLANSEFYQQTGNIPPGTMKALANGVYIPKQDSTYKYKSIKGHIEVDKWVKSIVNYTPYLPTNTWYPNRVKVVLGEDVPAQHREFYLVPIVQTGQQGFFATGAQYSEGAVYLETAEGQRIGRGFLESTGYADMRRQALRLAGMPSDEKMMELLSRHTLTLAQSIQCTVFLAEPENQTRLKSELELCKGL